MHSQDKLNEAHRLVSDKNLPPFVTEDPFFKTIHGYVCACFGTQKLSIARSSFEYAINMNFEPEYRHLRVWFQAERSSGINDDWCLRIADFVLQGKRYEEREKMEMLSRKATSLFARAQERLHTDPSGALKDLHETLRLHLKAYRLYVLSNDMYAQTSMGYAKNTAFLLLNMLAKSPVPWESLDILEDPGRSPDIYLDPISAPIRETLQTILRNIHKPESAARTKQKIRLLIDIFAKNNNWLYLETRDSTISKLSEADAALNDRIVSLRIAVQRGS
jgi:hypothetical protein